MREGVRFLGRVFGMLLSSAPFGRVDARSIPDICSVWAHREEREQIEAERTEKI